MLQTIKIPNGYKTDPKPKRESTYQLLQKILVRLEVIEKRLDEHDKRFERIEKHIGLI